MTMQTLRQNLWDALHDAEDPNVDVGNWPPERAIDKIVVVWSNGVGNGPGQIALWQKNVVHTLRMIGEKGGVGYSLNVVLKD